MIKKLFDRYKKYLLYIVIELLVMILTTYLATKFINGGSVLLLTFIVGLIGIGIFYLVEPKDEKKYDNRFEEIEAEIIQEVADETKYKIEKSDKKKCDDESMVLYLKSKQDMYNILKESNNPAYIGIIVSFLGIFSAIISSMFKTSVTPATSFKVEYLIMLSSSNTGLSDIEYWFITLSIVFLLIGCGILFAINKNKDYSMKINILNREAVRIQKRIDDKEEKVKLKEAKMCQIKQCKIVSAKLEEVKKYEKEENENLIQELKEIQKLLKGSIKSKNIIKNVYNKIIKDIF